MLSETPRVGFRSKRITHPDSTGSSSLRLPSSNIDACGLNLFSAGENTTKKNQKSKQLN
jgi:hypothetical protein